MHDFLKSAGRDQHLALLMVEFAFHLMQLLDNINKDSFQVSPSQEFSAEVNPYKDGTFRVVFLSIVKNSIEESYWKRPKLFLL
jgi:hypothetical protein